MAHALFQRIGIGWPDIQLSLRATVAAVLSLIAAMWLGLDYPIYAFIAAVIVTDLKPGMSQKLGLAAHWRHAGWRGLRRVAELRTAWRTLERGDRRVSSR
jgi:hypothetical protein